MEIKDERARYLLCMSCLCVDRSLHKITDLKLNQFYVDILREIPLCIMPQVVPNICWECKALLQKFKAFREQIQDSYRILQTYTNENLHECLLSDVSRPPRLKIYNVGSISFIPGNDFVDLKDEVKMEANDGHDSSYSSDAWKLEGQTAEQLESDASDNEPKEKILTILCEETNEKESKPKKRTRLMKKVPLVPDIEECKAFMTQANSCHEDINSIASVNAEEANESDSEVTDSKDQFKDNSRDEIVTAKKEKRIKTNKKTGKVSSVPPILGKNILTVELSYEEMLKERARAARSAAFARARFRCEPCVRVFRGPGAVRRHRANNHSPNLGDYVCPICYIIVSSVDLFTAHYKRHILRFECGICHKRTANLKTIHKHLRTRHTLTLRQYKCNICGKISNSVDTHRYHKDTHKARVPCKDCDKTFSHRAGLMNHRLAVHEEKNEFPCNQCDKVFRWKTSLSRHQAQHQKETKGSGRAYCTACDIAFSSVCSLQRHLRNSLKHVTHDQLKFICDHCNSRFADKTKLRNHIEEKHLRRTYQCHICHKPSKNRVGLEQHVRNVHKGRPNNKICHHCGKGFPTKVQLESHIRSHTGERPFICEYCPTTFSQPSNLYKHHRQVHMNIKAKKYPLCKKKNGNQSRESDHSMAQYMPENIFGL